MHEMDIEHQAEMLAKSAHDSINHRRKYTDEPYWVHPQRVVNILKSITNDQAILAAAWLHDVLEDVAPLNNQFNEDTIKNKLGGDVLQLVLEVTDISKKEDGNRKIRKAIDRAHLAEASINGKLIKLADVLDNVIDIRKNDPGFFKVFKQEILLGLDDLRVANEMLYTKIKELL